MLVSLSLISLASGARGRPVARGVQNVVGTVSRPFLQGMNALENSVAYVASLIFDYGAVQERNLQLEHTMGVMLQRSAHRAELAAENGRLRELLAFERDNPQFTLHPAQVLQHSGGLLTIDQGSTHGMLPSMCVITAEGVIGVLTRVDFMTSIVATLQDPQCRIDAMIRRNRVRGTVHGSSSDLSKICEMLYIELKHDVRLGDVVVTSPDSIFPPGFPIGLVTDLHPDEGFLWNLASIEPIADPFNVDEVLVLLRAGHSWQEKAGTTSDSPVQVQIADLLETMSIQERYAP